MSSLQDQPKKLPSVQLVVVVVVVVVVVIVVEMSIIWMALSHCCCRTIIQWCK